MSLEVVGPDGAGGAALDAMLETLGTAIAADPFLGGLCDFFGSESPDFNDRSTEALASTNWATVRWSPNIQRKPAGLTPRTT
jgi:hypothetical protein